MPSFKPREQKTLEGGDRVIVYKDSTGAWYVGAPAAGDCFPVPMGAFITREAARRWADGRFPGGAWSPATGEPPLPAGTHLPAVRRGET